MFDPASPGRKPPIAADAADLALGRRLRQVREQRRLARRTVAKAVGVSPQQIEKYESGLTRVAIGRLLRFADVLDVPISVLLIGLGTGVQAEGIDPTDPAFADAASAFVAMSRINRAGLRQALLSVLVASGTKDPS